VKIIFEHHWESETVTNYSLYYGARQSCATVSSVSFSGKNVKEIFGEGAL